MSATTTEGTGHGSVDRVKSRILNGDVKDSNLLLTTVISGNLENVELIKAPNGDVNDMDGHNLVIKGGDGYAEAGENDDADGGDVVISGGLQHGDGNSGDVFINGGDSSTDFNNSDAGDLFLRGGDGIGPGDSDGGDVQIRGGNCGEQGSDGEAGNVDILGGNSIGSDPGNIYIKAGDTSAQQNGGSVSIYGGNSENGDAGHGGNVMIGGGYSSSGGMRGDVIINSMLQLPVYDTQVQRNQGHANHPNPQNGMICYVVELNALTIYANGTWRTLSMDAVV